MYKVLRLKKGQIEVKSVLYDTVVFLVISDVEEMAVVARTFFCVIVHISYHIRIQ